MSGTTGHEPPAPDTAEEPTADGLVVQHVRHGYWKYPIIALALAILLGLLGVFAGSPNSPRATIAKTSQQDPGGAVLAFTQELAGMSSSAGNEKEFGLGPPAKLFVTGPLQSFAPLLGGNVTTALGQYQTAPASQQASWATSGRCLRLSRQMCSWPRPGTLNSIWRAAIRGTRCTWSLSGSTTTRRC